MVGSRGDGPGRHLPRRRTAGTGLPGRPGPRRLRAPRVRRRLGTFPGPNRRRDRLYTHGIRAVDLKPGGPDRRSTSPCGRGVTVRGRVARPGRPARPGRLGLQPAHAQQHADGRMEAGTSSMTATAATCATAASRCTGSIPATTPRSPSSSSSPTASSAPRSGSRAGRRRMERSPSASSRCGTAMARLVGPDGKPLDRYPARDPGSRWSSPRARPRSGRAAKDGPLFAAESVAFRIDPVNFRHRLPVRRPGPAHVPRPDPGRRPIASWTSRRSVGGVEAGRSARSSPSSRRRGRSTWATSSSPGPEGGTDMRCTGHPTTRDKVPGLGAVSCRAAPRSPPRPSGMPSRRVQAVALAPTKSGRGVG